ncbi:hypothetical protein GUL16_22080 [Stenotrophomonas maltophilia]|jgi:hypothetical protein|nr:hypothetical protein [Stenotrophomonas pavanii]MBC9091268.1 hypothetical protein [Stenotrophomonas maltophilia]MCF3486373.1 hypothetical protein [Stenotrophomonas maltophilia]
MFITGWPDGWIGRSRVSGRARRSELSAARFARDVLPAAWNSPERNASDAADFRSTLTGFMLGLTFRLLSSGADLGQ